MNKLYFARLLPVEVNWKGSSQKYTSQLFLCSRDIKIGDSVKFQLAPNVSPWRELKVIDKYDTPCINGVTRETLVVQEDNCKIHTSNDEFCVKIMGPISQDATWITEGMEFDEDQVYKNMVCPDCLDHDHSGQCSCYHRNYTPVFRDYSIKGPCGHFH